MASAYATGSEASIVTAAALSMNVCVAATTAWGKWTPMLCLKYRRRCLGSPAALALKGLSSNRSTEPTPNSELDVLTDSASAANALVALAYLLITEAWFCERV